MEPLKKNTFNVNTEYDYKYDIYCITVANEFNFKESLELEDGVILDFDENNIPVSLEILDISERLGVKKQQLKNAKIHMKIISNEDIIKLNLTFFYKVHEMEHKKTINSKLANNFNIPSMETIATA